MSTNGGRHAAHVRRRRRAGALRLVLTALALALAVAVVGGVVLVVRDGRSPGSSSAAEAAPPTATSAPAAGTSPPTPVPAPSTPAEPTFDRARLSIDDPTSPWVVVDKVRPLAPLDYAPADLVPIGGHELRAEAAQAMTDMFAAAAAEGLTLSVQSAYRSYDYQVNTFRQQVARFGEAQAEIQVARPGYSEHQTGLAADIGGGGCDIETCFASTAEGRWVAANGHRYGFVVRYPEGAQGTTGYKFEPWHVRYVGVALATELQETGVPTLEDFFGLPAAPGYAG